MAQYVFDPSQLSAGNYVPSGWTEVGSSGRVSISDAHSFGRSMRVTGLNTAAFDAAVVWSAVGTVAPPLEIFMICSWTGSDIAYPGPAYFLSTSPWNGYKGEVNQRNARFQIQRIDNGSFTFLSWASLSGVTDGSVWNVLLRVESDGTHRAKAWLNGDSEPSSWLLQLSDVTYTSGLVGVEINRFGTCFYFWIGVGTAGDSAPRPSVGTVYDEGVSFAFNASQVSLGSADVSGAGSFVVFAQKGGSSTGVLSAAGSAHAVSGTNVYGTLEASDDVFLVGGAAVSVFLGQTLEAFLESALSLGGASYADVSSSLLSGWTGDVLSWASLLLSASTGVSSGAGFTGAARLDAALSALSTLRVALGAFILDTAVSEPPSKRVIKLAGVKNEGTTETLRARRMLA